MRGVSRKDASGGRGPGGHNVSFSGRLSVVPTLVPALPPAALSRWILAGCWRRARWLFIPAFASGFLVDDFVSNVRFHPMLGVAGRSRYARVGRGCLGLATGARQPARIARAGALARGGAGLDGGFWSVFFSVAEAALAGGAHRILSL